MGGEFERCSGQRSRAGTRKDPRRTYTANRCRPQAGHDYMGTDTNQVYVRLGQAALSRTSKDYDTFLVLNQILGANGAFESRLWQGLRQKRGLVYSVGSSLSTDADRGDFRIEFERTTRSCGRSGPLHSRATAAAAENAARNPNGTHRSQGSTGKRRTALRSIGRRTSRATDGYRHTNDLPLDYYRTLNERFARITAADVQRVARTYLHPNRLIQVYAGPPGVWETQSL